MWGALSIEQFTGIEKGGEGGNEKEVRREQVEVSFEVK